MFNKHFQDELRFLREMGKAYAERNPAAAGLLGERSGDPDVERLLEGVAFLTARIRERLDGAGPEIVHDVAELMLPHFLRPLPAASIVEMLPIPGALRTRHQVPRGAEIGSVPVDGTSCRFTTTADLDLVPATVQDVQLDRASSSAPVLRVQLQTGPQGSPAVFHEDGLRLYLHAELPLASTLLLWFARHLRGVQVNGLPRGDAVQLPASAVTLPGLGPGLPLLPWPDLAPPGYRLLQEYFTLPQKLLFVDVRGLHAASAVQGERFELAFQLERPPALPSELARDALRTNCVPVVNVFRTRADPVSVTVSGEEHLLRAAAVPPAHMAIHGVESVLGAAAPGGVRPAYAPFFGFRHLSPAAQGRHYRLRRALSPLDDEVDTWISIGRPLEIDAGGAVETLSIEVTASNRQLPARLRLGDLRLPTPTSPTQARFRDIVPVSRPVRPPLGTELHWRLVAHLAAGRSSLGSAAALRRLVALYNLRAATEQQTGRANAMRVEAIEAVRAAPALRLVRGAPVRGTRFDVDVSEGGFASVGDAFLFGCALDDVLASQASLSSFSELALHLQPTERVQAWPPRNGWRSLL